MVHWSYQSDAELETSKTRTSSKHFLKDSSRLPCPWIPTSNTTVQISCRAGIDIHWVVQRWSLTEQRMAPLPICMKIRRIAGSWKGAGTQLTISYILIATNLIPGEQILGERWCSYGTVNVTAWWTTIIAKRRNLSLILCAHKTRTSMIFNLHAAVPVEKLTTSNRIRQFTFGE